MNRLLLLLLFAVPCFVNAQDIPVNKETGKVEYIGVVEADGDKHELFSRGKRWTALAFKSAQHVIQAEDKEEGYLVVKGSSVRDFIIISNRIPISQSVAMNFTVALDFKDKRYRYIISDISFKMLESPGDYAMQLDEMFATREEVEAEWLKAGEKEKLSKTERSILDVRMSMFKQYSEYAHTTITDLIRSLKNEMSTGVGDDW